MNNTSQYYQNCRSEMASFLPDQYSTVLDIGCGEGNFRDNLRLKHEYWGVEPNEFHARVASMKLDKILIGTYEEIYHNIPDQYFDLVICNDVLEHMIDHDSFLQCIIKKMKEGGYLLVSVPNVRYVSNMFEIIVRRDWRYRDDGILDRTHLRFFSKKSIIRTIHDNGFIVQQLSGINPYRSSSYIKTCLLCLAILLLGPDVRFFQFGILTRHI
jgi:2-polyprenyl-3-methyl-5-hydroxy-6-metoxy-1,4-benzoquinol methylase